MQIYSVKRLQWFRKGPRGDEIRCGRLPLKPSGKEEIIRIIEEIIDSLEDSLISRLHNNEYLALLKNNVLNRLISGTISSRELKDKLALLQLDLSSGCFSIVSVEIAKNESMVEDDASWQIFSACNICDEIMVKSGKGVAFTDFSGRVNMIIRILAAGRRIPS